MKIAVYNLYLSTLGGGELHMGKMAELLSKDHDVDILTNKYFDLNRFSKHLNLDLSRVKLRVFPYISSEYASTITKDYDLFINATYLSYMKGYAKKNIYLTFFPTPFDVDFKFAHKLALFLFRNISRKIYNWFLNKEKKYKDTLIPIEGIHDPKKFIMGRPSWTSGKAILEIQENLMKKGFVKLKINSGRKFNAPDTFLRISLGNQLLYEYDKLSKNKSTIIKIGIPSKKNQIENENKIKNKDKIEYKNLVEKNNIIANNIITIESNSFCPANFYDSSDMRQLGVSIKNISTKSILRNLIYFLIGFLPNFLLNFPDDLSFLDTYDLILAISKYTQKWIKKIWNRENFVFYPPVDIDRFKKVEKENIILGVGRFFVGHHNKKQLELVKTFKELCKSGLNDWHLYLVGGVGGKKEHFKYLDSVNRASEGYPIVIKTNIPREELNDIYSKSKIFWHASGLEEDEKKHPERFEHFGVSTVEAMAAGCIPVVINRGGQSEIVKDGTNGFLFSNLEQLKEITLRIINKGELQKKIRKNLLEDCKKYSSENFKRRLQKIIKNLI